NHPNGPTLTTRDLYATSSISYSGASRQEIDGGPVTTSFAVQSTASGTPVSGTAGKDGNPFTVGDHGLVMGIRSALTLTGLGHSSLLVDDASATAQDRVTVNATRVGADAADRFFATGGSLAYSGMSSLTLNLSRANDDVALLTPSATTPFTVNGSL